MKELDVQKKLVLNHLLIHGTITQMEAYREYQCARLASRIYDLRKDGFNIVTTMIKKQVKPSFFRRILGATTRIVNYAQYSLM